MHSNQMAIRKTNQQLVKKSRPGYRLKCLVRKISKLNCFNNNNWRNLIQIKSSTNLEKANNCNKMI